MQRQHRGAFENLKNIGQSALFFEYRFYRSACVKNTCCMFRAAFLSRMRRCVCMTLKMRQFRSSSERQTIVSQRGEEREAMWTPGRCIRECIVPSFFAVKNKLPTVRAGRAVYFFFTLSLSLCESGRACIWRLKRLYYRRASPTVERITARGSPERLRSACDTLREQHRGAGNK